MITCERCGTAMPDNAAICPSCGTTTAFARNQTPPSDYGYSQGYGSQPSPIYSPQPGPGYAPQQGYGQSYNPPQMVYQQPVSININTTTTTSAAPASSGSAVLVEVLLNLFFGIYGVGWLMAGETTVGVILLVCSLLLYWPTLVLVGIFTLGLGLLCLGPLAIVGLIINAILLNNTVKRKTALILVQPIQPIQGYPPR